MLNKISSHNQAVYEFLKECQKSNPTQYESVCDKYPTISMRQWRRIRDREHLSGLTPHKEDQPHEGMEE